MEKKLLQMFPTGQWTTGEKAWAVKDGMYFCHAAEIVDGEIVLTELGNRLLGITPEKEKPAEEVVIPELAAPKAALKKTGLRK